MGRTGMMIWMVMIMQRTQGVHGCCGCCRWCGKAEQAAGVHDHESGRVWAAGRRGRRRGV